MRIVEVKHLGVSSFKNILSLTSSDILYAGRFCTYVGILAAHVLYVIET